MTAGRGGSLLFGGVLWQTVQASWSSSAHAWPGAHLQEQQALGSKQSQTKLTNQTIKTTIKQVLLISATYNQDLSSPVFFFLLYYFIFFPEFSVQTSDQENETACVFFSNYFV